MLPGVGALALARSRRRRDMRHLPAAAHVGTRMRNPQCVGKPSGRVGMNSVNVGWICTARCKGV